jgi:beta-lactamase class A
MRRRYGCLLAVLACACLACGPAAKASPTPPPAATAATAETFSPLPSDPPTASPVPTATPKTSVPAWTTKDVKVYAKASDEGAVQVHLGRNFPITLTSASAQVEGNLWYEADWQTPGRHATGWLLASSVTLTTPSTSQTTAGVDALDEDLAEYLSGLGARVGVDAYDVTRRVTYTYNADLSYFGASSVKVPIMLTVFSQIEAQKRAPTAYELSLLRTMIEYSDNYSAEVLYEAIGAQKGINAFMKRAGISGLVPSKPGWWGHSTIKPATMVALLTRLYEGTVLNDADRKLALYYMQHINSAGRVGIGDSSPAGATIAMKDGWTTALDGTGTFVANTSGIVTLGGETYILSVYTDHDHGLPDGWKIIRHVAKVFGERLMPST